MSYLARLKEIEKGKISDIYPNSEVPKVPEVPFDTFDTSISEKNKKISAELINRPQKNKPAIIAELKQEERRAKLLQMLENRPEIQRAFITDMKSNSDNVILSLAIRDQYTFEMLIPKHKYDAFLILELLNREVIN